MGANVAPRKVETGPGAQFVSSNSKNKTTDRGFGEVENASAPGQALDTSIDDRDKIELLQMALHNDFDKRHRTTRIPEDNYTQAVAAYKCVAAQDRALKLLCSL
ncbi:hypothetical protein E4U23_005100 [Claviceps purpurea]|nr:hypothetical protein E4U23_005100 [Claviceps purpurea]